MSQVQGYGAASFNTNITPVLLRILVGGVRRAGFFQRGWRTYWKIFKLTRDTHLMQQFIIINNSTCFEHLYAHLQEY